MWQKILTGIIINVGCYLVGRKIERYVQKVENLKQKMEEQNEVIDIKDAAHKLNDSDYDRLLRESTEGTAEFLFDIRTSDIHGTRGKSNAGKSNEESSDQ